MQASYSNGHYIIFLSPNDNKRENLIGGIECKLDMKNEGEVTPKQLKLRRVDSDKLFDYGHFGAFTFADYVEVRMSEALMGELLSKKAVLHKYEGGTITIQQVSPDVLKV